MNRHSIAALLLAAGVMSAAGGQAQSETGAIVNPFRGVMQDRTSTSEDEALYVEKCSTCHRQMGMGTVLLSRRVDPAVAIIERRENLTEAYIILAARQGIGNMPRISRAEVSDDQMARIARYLAGSGEQ